MGALEALLTLRRGAALYAGLPISEVVAIVSAVESDAKSLNFTSGLELHSVVSERADINDPPSFYRTCIFEVIVARKVAWTRTITLGRARFYSSLERDQQQCLREANLMVEPPTDDIVAWWDRLSVLVRQAHDDDKYLRSRIAEKLTLAHERSRLAKLGFNIEPRWVAVEDNGAGYDVLSYSLTDTGAVNLLIEVKSTVASPLRFIVTRNEWKKALAAQSSYLFHIWDLTVDPPRLHQRTVSQVAPHIPDHKEKGEWLSVEVKLSAQ